MLTGTDGGVAARCDPIRKRCIEVGVEATYFCGYGGFQGFLRGLRSFAER